MRATTLSLVFGPMTMALAAPSHHHPSHHHKYDHHSSGYASVSGIPYPLGNVTNVTALSGSSLQTLLSTATLTVTAPSAETTIAAAAQNAEDKVANAQPTQSVADVEDKELSSQASPANDACNVVTVTYNPTTTITVSAAPSNIAPPSAISPAASVSPAAAQPPASSVALAEAASSSSTPLSETLASPSPSSLEVAAASSAVSSIAGSTTPSTGNTIPSSNSNSDVASASASSALASASSPATAPTNNAGFRTKRGILASGSGQLALVSGLTPYSKISWVGDWYSGPPSNLPSSMQFVPQNYGKQSDVKGEWTSNAKKAVAAGDKYFMSFGEPGTPNAQLQMDPQEAVTLFMQKMQPYAEQGVTIGAPGTLQTDQDYTWLSSFLDLCDKAGCSIGFLAMHWFWKAEEVQSFKDTLGRFVTLAKGKPVWVDNFQASGTAAAQKEFLQEVVPWLDAQAGVPRYAYVPVDPGNGEGFLNDDGKTLSDLGAYYANL